MTKFFSKTTNGFFDSEIHSELPIDSVELSIEQYESLFVGQAQGKQITSDESGNPILIDPPEPNYEYLRKTEYPPVTDYLDGIVKGDQAQIDKYIADCLAVKEKYPKPQ